MRRRLTLVGAWLVLVAVTIGAVSCTSQAREPEREAQALSSQPVARMAVEGNSWVALRQFPQLHTNPVNVLVAGKPIRASRDSARWAPAAVDQLWRARSRRIADRERGEAERAYEQARVYYRRAAAEAPAAR